MTNTKMKLDVCGLYTMNMPLWFNMLCYIIDLYMLLMQFHLLMSDRFVL